MRPTLYPYDDVITDDGYLWAVAREAEALRVIVAFDNISQRFVDRLASGEVQFVLRSRICQLGLDAELNHIERRSGGGGRLECTVTIRHSHGLCLAEAVVDFLANCRKHVPLGKLFNRIPERQLDFDDIVRNLGHSVDGAPVIEVNEYSQAVEDMIVVPLDAIVYEIDYGGSINGEQILYLLTQGTRKDLDLLRRPVPSKTPHAVKPHGWLLSRLPLFVVREHFAFIDRPMLGGRPVPGLRHASAKLFDPLSYRGITTQAMVEVFNDTGEELRVDGLGLKLYRPERRRCSVQAPCTSRLAGLVAPASAIRERMDASLKGSEIGGGKRIKHAAFIVDPAELDKLDRLKSSAVVEARDRTSPETAPALSVLECPEHDILEEIAGGYIKATGFLLSYYFPRWDIGSRIEACKDKLCALVFRCPSYSNGLFFSEYDVLRLKYFRDLGIRILWMRDDGPYEYQIRNDCGFFLKEELAEAFRNATFFACYGSSAQVDPSVERDLPGFFDRLSALFGQIGVVTGGGPGLMEVVNRVATRQGILSASCGLSTEFSSFPQDVNQHCNIVMYFDEYCRHIRQKNFAIARFPVFFPGGLGTLEEVGIEMCNWKLGVRRPAPYVFVGGDYWHAMMAHLEHAAAAGMIDPKTLRNLFVVQDLAEAASVYERFVSSDSYEGWR